MQTVNTRGGGGSGVAVGAGLRVAVATSEVGDTRTISSCGGLGGWGVLDVQAVNTNKTASRDNRKKDAFSFFIPLRNSRLIKQTET